MDNIEYNLGYDPKQAINTCDICVKMVCLRMMNMLGIKDNKNE